MLSILRKLICCSPPDRQLIFRASGYLFLWRVVILTLPFRLWCARLGQHQGDAAAENSDQVELIQRIQAVVTRVARRLPWQANCLNRALATMSLLQRERIASTLYLGVRHSGKGEAGIEAHAWLAIGQRVLSGGEEMAKFHEISRFTWSPR